MNMHHIARLTPKGRELLTERLETRRTSGRRCLRHGRQYQHGLKIAAALS